MSNNISVILDSANVEKVCNFCFTKLTATPAEWRRVLKTLNVLEFICKNGSPQAVMQLKRDLYKISSLCNFNYMESGIERGNCIREKVNLICDLLSSEARLHQERAEAYEYRKKFYPGAGPTAE